MNSILLSLMFGVALFFLPVIGMILFVVFFLSSLSRSRAGSSRLGQDETVQDAHRQAMEAHLTAHQAAMANHQAIHDAAVQQAMQQANAAHQVAHQAAMDTAAAHHASHTCHHHH